VGVSTIAAVHPVLGEYYLYADAVVPLLFTENETNNDRLFPEHPNATAYVKDGIDNFVVEGQQDVVNPDRQGTKAAAHYQATAGAGQTTVIRLALSDSSPDQKGKTFGKDFDHVFVDRLREADEFYQSVTPPSVSKDAANVMRQAIAGMLWDKQYYFLDADQWLEEHHAHPLHAGSREFRNREWFHMVNENIISMPDKWEYPWYAAWDLAFHTLPLSIVDLALFFCAFTTYRRLVSHELGIDYFGYGFALLKALVPAKVILLGWQVRFARILDDRPLIFATLYKVVVFSILTLAFEVFEHVLGGFVHGTGLVGVLQEVMSTGRDELLARALVVLFSFVPFFVFDEIGWVLGEGRLSAMFLETR
jgi:hypothetical protein